jgi:hybrid cluster-associated redox disulfide protein
MNAMDIDDPTMTLWSLFDGWPRTVPVFLSHRMLCFGCPIAPFHTVADACVEYALDEVPFRRELHEAIDT